MEHRHNNTSIPHVDPTDAGIYSVTIPIGRRRCSAGSAATVVVNPLPATPAPTNNGPLCTGATLNLSTPAVSRSNLVMEQMVYFAIRNPSIPMLLQQDLYCNSYQCSLRVQLGSAATV